MNGGAKHIVRGAVVSGTLLALSVALAGSRTTRSYCLPADTHSASLSAQLKVKVKVLMTSPDEQPVRAYLKVSTSTWGSVFYEQPMAAASPAA